MKSDSEEDAKVKRKRFKKVAKSNGSQTDTH